jgi:SAM-dependent methyltransferase
MKNANDWFADEEFWSATYDMLFPEARIAAAPEEVEQILALTARIPPARVLDLGCGPGRHSIALAGLGFQVTGVDRTAFLLDKAVQRSAVEDIDVEWIRSDMRDFVRPSAYDLALSLFTSFGFFWDDAENQRVLENLFESLGPRGTLVVDVAGKEVIAKIFEPTSSHDVEGSVVVQRRRVIDNWSRMSNEWMWIQDTGVRSFRFEHWIYSGRELEQMLRRVGFEEVRLFGDFLGRPYDANAQRLVVVGTKS